MAALRFRNNSCSLVIKCVLDQKWLWMLKDLWKKMDCEVICISAADLHWNCRRKQTRDKINKIQYNRPDMYALIQNTLQIQFSPLLSLRRFHFCWRTKAHISENEGAYFRERRRIFQRTKTHISENEDAYFRERRRIFQRTKTHISENEDTYFRERRRIKTKTQKKTENARKRKRKKKRRRIKTKTQKNASLLGHYTKACWL